MEKTTIYYPVGSGNYILTDSDHDYLHELEEKVGYFFTSQELEDKLRKAFSKGEECGYSFRDSYFNSSTKTVPNEDEYIASLNL